MSRIGTYGAGQMYLSRIMATQQRLNTEQLQVATEKKSPNYTGIATDANRLLNFESGVSQATQFTKNNDYAATRLTAAQTSLSAVQTTMKQFRDQLNNFMQGDTKNPSKIKDLQTVAMQAMTSMSSYMNVSVDGQYLFSGGRVSTAPVSLPASSLADFQAIYDGSTHTFPTTRSANLQDINLTSADTGSVKFNAANGAIIPANAGAFSKVASGSLVTVAGTASNNSAFTVTGHVATNVNGLPLTETNNAGANSFISYSGGNLLNGATGNLAFAFNSAGQMTITPGTANALNNLTTGSKFTIKGSTDGNADGFGDYDGAYVVTSNANGVVTVENDTSMAFDETVDVSALSLKQDTNADGVPDATVGLGAITGDARFHISGNTVTLTVPPGGTALNTQFAANSVITIGGSDSHNGSFKVTSSTATTVTFNINPDALRTSQFVPQTGRNDVTITYPGQTNQLIPTTYGSLTFSPTGTGGETITAATANAFTDSNGVSPAVGAVITLKSTKGVNDGAYTVVSNDGTNIVVKSTTVATETSATSSFASTSWYKGDNDTPKHRIDVNTTVDIGLSAADTAFEKAFRAMGLIAQGAVGTAGGLDNNQDRLSAARYLIYDAMDGSPVGPAPFGTEQRGSVSAVQEKVGITQSVISERNNKHQQFIALFQARADELENIDKTTAITSLLADQRSLEASYQTLSTVRSLSLLNYMK